MRSLTEELLDVILFNGQLSLVQNFVVQHVHLHDFFRRYERLLISKGWWEVVMVAVRKESEHSIVSEKKWNYKLSGSRWSRVAAPISSRLS